MKNKSQYFSVVTEFDDSGFKPLPRKKLEHELNIDQLQRNLMSLFKNRVPEETLAKMTDEEKRNTPGCSIMDYAWTKSVQDQFYNHPYHKRLVDKLEGNGRFRYCKYLANGWGMFKLNYEPCTIED